MVALIRPLETNRSQGNFQGVFERAFSSWEEGGLGIPKPQAFSLGKPAYPDVYEAAAVAMRDGVKPHDARLSGLNGLYMLTFFCSAVAERTSLVPFWGSQRKITTNVESWWRPSFTILVHDHFWFMWSGAFWVNQPMSDWLPSEISVQCSKGGYYYNNLNSAAFFNHSNPVESVRSAERALRIEERDREALLLEGFAKLRLGYYGEATESFSRAAKGCHPEYKEMLALTAYGQGVARAKERPFNKGQQLKHYEEAEKHLSTALKHDPKMGIAKDMLLRIHRLKNSTGLSNLFWRAAYWIFNPAIPRCVPS